MKYYRLFFGIFILIALALPLFHMNTAEITEQENRTLAKFPKVHKKGKLNSNYGKEFESWLGDRFWGRSQLLDARFQALYKINGRIENEKAFIGDDGWMFKKSNTVNIPSIVKQRKKIKKDADILKKFADKFKEKNIPIYLVFFPEREVLYQKYWEKYYKVKPRLNYSDEIKKLLKDYSNISVISVQSELEEISKKELVFYKDDIHLTNFSRQVIVKKIFQKMKDDDLWGKKEVILKSKTENKKQEYVAYLSAVLGFPGKKEKILPFMSLWFSDLKSEDIEKKEYSVLSNNGYKGVLLTPYVKSINNKAPILKTGIFIGPCYTEDAYEVLKPLFRTSIKIRLNVSEAGKDAVKFVQNKSRELFNLKKDSSVIIMVLTPGYSSHFKEYLK